MLEEELTKLMSDGNYLEAVVYLRNSKSWKFMTVEEVGVCFEKFRKFVAPKDIISLADEIGRTVYGIHEFENNFVIYL